MEHRTLAEALARVLTSEGFTITGWVPDLSHVPAGYEDEPFDLLLLDLPVGPHAISRLREIASHIGETAIVLLAKPANRLDWMAAGVRGFSSPHRSARELVETLKSVLRRDEICEPEVAYEMFAELASLEQQRRSEHRSRNTLLTHREREVLGLLCKGLGNRKIASELCLSTHTVKNHVHHVLSKLRVETRWEAAAKAQSRGWAAPGSEA